MGLISIEVVEGVARGRVNGADVKLAILFEQGGQREVVAAIDAFLINPDVGFATEVVDLAEEIAFLVGGANPPGVELREFQWGGHV